MRYVMHVAIAAYVMVTLVIVAIALTDGGTWWYPAIMGLMLSAQIVYHGWRPWRLM